ncbi:nucleolar protein dao-5-like isoform X5 [Pieris brassicae]|uniref:nucleolar protein dao-5-like isoform X5 n=1 Tax=Pieris brassicae TaxID=7116 RepID=UPI001E65E8A4|nr:nucleolar protein dao-5-like isoform X5 [Pieris brassicae]
MAPSPEYDKEPKAPDKAVVNISSDDSKILYNHTKEHSSASELRSSTAPSNTDVENKLVESLDDGQLRALLDEAITYKCPKDREGKSSLFKELLEEVEQDEEACEAAARAGRAGRRDHHSSLQDLVAAMAAEPAPRRRHHHSHNVSARTHHGGSLPSGVDRSFLFSEEPTRGAYVATVRCVNPPPLAERRVSASDANAPGDIELVTRRSKPTFPMTYTARATLEIGSGSVGTGRAVTTTTASNQIDSAIPFSCITTPEVVASCNTTSTTQSTVAVDPKPLQLESCYNAVASLTGAPAPAAAAPPASAPQALQLSRNVLPTSSLGGLLLASESCPSVDENKKSLDENGNAVHGFSSPASGSSQQKKPRRKKSSKNETVIKSHQIDGYQGNKDLNEVLRFIESNADGARGSKARAKHKDDSDDKGKKRCADRRKDKESKVKRASSLEERSRTKLEDLTDKPSAHRRPAAPPAKPERRSWGDDARAALLLPDDAELTDFQTVTKRRKPRRRPDEAEPARPPPSPEPRASPSERSNDSNDDFDSAHSPPPAPVPAPPPPPPPPALPPPHPPASYADIARTRNNIPDLIESCNFYAEGDEPKERPPSDRKAAAPAGEPMEGYPALAARRPRDKAGGGATRPQRKERGEARVAEPAPDVVADRRPPVILLAAAATGRDMDGITFGFDVNEQLLSGGRRARCDLLEGVPVRAGCAALRYVPPALLPHATHTHQIIDYVGTAWEDIIRCSNGKVRYFSD